MSIFCHSACPSAKVVDGTLVLNLPNAKNPLIWRLDLRQVTSSAFEVRQDNDNYALILRASENDVRDIASFASRKKALKALMAAGRALEEGQQGTTLTRARMSPGKWILGLLLVGVIIFAYDIITSPALQTANFAVPNTAQTSQENTAPVTGVPVTADDFLKSRQ